MRRKGFVGEGSLFLGRRGYEVRAPLRMGKEFGGEAALLMGGKEKGRSS